jgi:hypothetical protein
MNFTILRHGFCAEHAQLVETCKNFPQNMCEVAGTGGSLKETCPDFPFVVGCQIDFSAFYLFMNV